MSKNHKQKNMPLWQEKLLHFAEPFSPKSPLSLSVIIPSHNSADRLYVSLKSLKEQEIEGELEVIVIDAKSTDRTREIVQQFGSFVSRIYTLESRRTADMLNRGRDLATKEYVTFLYPGSFYVSKRVFVLFQGYIEKHNSPDFLYCGYIPLSGGTIHPLYAFERHRMCQGHPPTSLNACVLKRDFLKKTPKFSKKITQQISFHFFTNLFKLSSKNYVRIDRYLVDVSTVPFVDRVGWRSYQELWWLIFQEYGTVSAIRWAYSSHQLSFFRWMWFLLRTKFN